jgi:hypothetical protein
MTSHRNLRDSSAPCRSSKSSYSSSPNTTQKNSKEGLEVSYFLTSRLWSWAPIATSLQDHARICKQCRAMAGLSKNLTDMAISTEITPQASSGQLATFQISQDSRLMSTGTVSALTVKLTFLITGISLPADYLLAVFQAVPEIPSLALNIAVEPAWSDHGLSVSSPSSPQFRLHIS